MPVKIKNSNHLAPPRLPPYHATAFTMIQLQKRQIPTVAGPLLIGCRKIDKVPHTDTEQTSHVPERPSWNAFG